MRGGSSRRRALTPPTPDAAPELRALLEGALEDAIRLLPMPADSIRHAALGRVSTSTIGRIDHDALTNAIAPDVIAGVVQRFGGAFSGTALLALDPSDALLWLQMDDGEGEPLERFVALGARMLGAIVERLAAARGDQVGFDAGTLEERPLMAALLSTHAPSDTVIVSLDAELAYDMDPTIDTLHTPFTVQLLLEPKTLQLLEASAAG
jgi:hypothetical protein